jgi:hypothetical protein
MVIEFYEISDFEKSRKSPIGYNSNAGNSINIPKNHEFEPPIYLPGKDNDYQ